MNFLYEPIEDKDPYGLKPLNLEDEELDEELEDAYVYAEELYEEEAYEEPGLGGFDDLRPFGSFSDGFGWDDTLF